MALLNPPERENPPALVQLPEPVCRFPDFAWYFVRRLKALCPAMAKVRLITGRILRLKIRWTMAEVDEKNISNS